MTILILDNQEEDILTDMKDNIKMEISTEISTMKFMIKNVSIEMMINFSKLKTLIVILNANLFQVKEDFSMNQDRTIEIIELVKIKITKDEKI
jgi:hypothetical protein